MIKINLNPEKRRKQKKVGNLFEGFSLSLNLSNVVYVVIFVIPIVISIAYFMYISNEVSKLETEKSNLSSEKEKYKKIANRLQILNKEVANLKKKIQELENLKMVYENLPKEKGLFLEVFEVISTSLPDGVWVGEMNLTRNSITLSGFSFRPEFISEFYKKVNQHYTSVVFSKIEKKDNKLNDYFVFTFQLSGFKSKKEEVKKVEP